MTRRKKDRLPFVMLCSYPIETSQRCIICGNKAEWRTETWYRHEHLFELMRQGVDKSKAELLVLNEGIKYQRQPGNVPLAILEHCTTHLAHTIDIFMGVNGAGILSTLPVLFNRKIVLYLIDRNETDDSTYPSVATCYTRDMQKFLDLYDNADPAIRIFVSEQK